MGAEEAVGGMEGVLRDAEVLLEEKHHPRGVSVLQTVAVGTVPHELAIVDLTGLIDLPVDDGIVFGTAQTIAQGSMDHLAVGQEPGPDDGTAETALG